MLRAGMIRQVAAGVYDILPLGLRVLRNIERIIREEMNAAGAQEVFLPCINPAELWKETGRWESTGKELLRLKDRKNREYCFAPTHEEVITDLVRREVKSYRQLPLNLYQIQTKFRDEVRPRFGVMRSREFVMKDAYSFDVSDAAAGESYQKMYAAYGRIFSRCGLRYRAVEADSGNIGGKLSQEFMVLADTGEDEVLTCASCGSAANIEKAQAHVVTPEKETTVHVREKMSTPDMRSAEEVSAYLKIDLERVLKTLVFVADDERVLAVIPGDREINEIALSRHLNATALRMATSEEVKALLGAPVGSLGPVDVEGKAARIIFDTRIFEGVAYAVGANEAGHHWVHVYAGRDFRLNETAGISRVRAGDLCENCGSELMVERGIEVGHVFKLGTKYSEQMGAMFLDENGRSQPVVMGCYGIGVARTAAAAIEQNHDAAGIIWPREIAPFELVIVCGDMKSAELVAAAEKLYAEAQALGTEVLFDDRPEGIGVKFKDSELLGIPYRITVGKKSWAEGKVEINCRKDGEKALIAMGDWKEWIENHRISA